MSSQTFKARVALSSWFKMPFMPEDVPATILAKSMSMKGDKKTKMTKTTYVEISQESDSE
jgi:hypothetical protein